MEVLLCTRNAFISVFYRSESCKRMHNSELFKENYVWSNEYKGPCRELVYTPLFPLNSTICHEMPLIEANWTFSPYNFIISSIYKWNCIWRCLQILMNSIIFKYFWILVQLKTWQSNLLTKSENHDPEYPFCDIYCEKHACSLFLFLIVTMKFITLIEKASTFKPWSRK